MRRERGIGDRNDNEKDTGNRKGQHMGNNVLQETRRRHRKRGEKEVGMTRERSVER